MVVDNGFKLLAKRKIEDENDPTGDSYSVLESLPLMKLRTWSPILMREV